MTGRTEDITLDDLSQHDRKSIFAGDLIPKVEFLVCAGAVVKFHDQSSPQSAQGRSLAARIKARILLSQRCRFCRHISLLA